MNYHPQTVPAKRKATRTYWVTVTGGNYRVCIDRAYWRSTSRIRHFAIVIFRKYFGGREPSFHWAKDGFMAEARDRRGNHVTIEQENWWDRFAPGATHMPRPICPMLLQKQAA
jgi:hypothetical protein